MDENCMRMAGNLRMQMSILAGALISEGKKDKAKNILDKCLTVMPEENIPFDAAIFAICGSYYELGDFTTANQIAKKMFDIYEGDLRIYQAQKPNRKSAYTRDIAQAKEILKRLTSLTQQFRQEALTKEFMNRLQTVLGPEDINPPTAIPQLQ